MGSEFFACLLLIHSVRLFEKVEFGADEDACRVDDIMVVLRRQGNVRLRQDKDKVSRAVDVNRVNCHSALRNLT
jgi:hypothetical protein